MRVIAGEFGGRVLAVPDGDAVRPTSDRVREAMFNALFSLGVLEGATVIDAYAGTGALGVEAVSRGAAHATFVERDRRARAVLESNLATLGVGDRATVVAGDGATHLALPGQGYDLALLDPPYDFDAWEALLVDANARLVVAESRRSVGAPGWQTRRRRTYGGTIVTILEPEPCAPATAGERRPE